MPTDLEILKLSGGLGLIAINAHYAEALERLWQQGLVSRVDPECPVPHYRRTPSGDLALPLEIEE